jgi:hypothetical protein
MLIYSDNDRPARLFMLNYGGGYKEELRSIYPAVVPGEAKVKNPLIVIVHGFFTRRVYTEFSKCAPQNYA